MIDLDLYCCDKLMIRDNQEYGDFMLYECSVCKKKEEVM